ncbi:DUF4920 domain-containing protein [Mucilaginibacter sp.]|uniref:DUF4920 domain-containing protein n=1 Tax=Mucilaginibacter sp. TaxID=1882438 RepID=UPI00260CAAA6|nr:DUF4920 domain-containing protein [Mucilaginibacter sp.]
MKNKLPAANQVKLTTITNVKGIMKKLALMVFIFCGFNCFAQKHTPLPHGMVFGDNPQNIAPVPATKIEAFMGKKIRQTTAITGTIIRVIKEKGGWFEMDAGHGKVIAAHFKNYNITLPKAITGRGVIIEGVAQRVLIADDMQHFAGDTVVGAKQHQEKVNPKARITFEVRGLMVDR